MKLWRYIPFVFFIATCVVLLFALNYEKAPASMMIGQTFPAIELPLLHEVQPDAGALRVVNLFASWCVPCIAELPQLAQIGEESGAVVEGIAWRDTPEDLNEWLNKYGNPFDLIRLDDRGEVGITLGIRGIPETFVVDAGGIIRMHHSGLITQQDVPDFVRQIEALR